jgi:hypothetical protein
MGEHSYFLQAWLGCYMTGSRKYLTAAVVTMTALLRAAVVTHGTLIYSQSLFFCFFKQTCF